MCFALVRVSYRGEKGKGEVIEVEKSSDLATKLDEIKDTSMRWTVRRVNSALEQKWVASTIRCRKPCTGGCMKQPAAEALYEAQHMVEHEGRGYVVFNPQNKPLTELPVIYGFNNGGSPGWMDAVLLAEDGACLGGHVCSSEAYMPADLGVLEGTRPDRHETFQKHYPDGYRMSFVGADEVRAKTNTGLEAAYAMNQTKSQDPA